MQSNACEPLKVTQEAVDAYERQSGFHGMGKIMVERGCWVIVPKEAVANRMRWNNCGNNGVQSAVSAAMCHDQVHAESAKTGSGGTS